MAVYQMKDLGAATSYLGIRITRDQKQRSIWIDQEDYIHNALTRFNLLNTNDTKTPLPEGVHLVATTEPTPLEKLTRYQQLIGTLLYASIGMHPDIAFAVTRLSRYSSTKNCPNVWSFCNVWVITQWKLYLLPWYKIYVIVHYISFQMTPHLPILDKI